MNVDDYIVPAVTVALAAPALAFLVLLAAAVWGGKPKEKTIGGLVRGAYGVATVASLVSAAAYVASGSVPRHVDFGPWFGLGHYGFGLGVGLDGLSLTYLVLIAFLSALLGSVSHRYLHREEGYRRFFLLLTLFSAGMSVLVLADSLGFLFIGWELVGLGSALLIAFYQERHAPARHGLFAYVVYRVCDVGILAAAVFLHQVQGGDALPVSGEAVALGTSAATLFGLLVLFGSMGKSGQLPFSGWLPRAMEGPTTSSAIFYGALSVHAGIYLLLRAQPLIAASAVATTAVLIVGAATALHGGLVGRVQTDAKSALAYATMTQLGVMLVEIGLGLTTLATMHLFAHAILRAFQLLRVPSALRDAEALSAAGVHDEAPPWFIRLLPAASSRWVHRFALERFGLEALFDRWLIAPILRLGQALDHAERRFLATLAGHHSDSESLPVARPTDEVRER